MEFALNNAPELTMPEITKKLFNKIFLSNIEFHINEDVIFAHSLELMKRSVVFQEQLDPSLFKPQIIEIKDYSYKSFYELIRFIYTEECDINIDNAIELFTLATEYKVVKLENQVLEFLLQRGVPLRIRLCFYAFCVTNNYELPYNVIKGDIARNLSAVMELNNFTLIDEKVIEDILKLDCVDENIKEVQIFNGLIRWMNGYCDTYEIDLNERRQKFENLLQLIRYPHMTMEEFRASVLNNCELFADKDICLMFKDPTPIPKPRKACDRKYDRRNILSKDTKSETKFSVSKEVLFTGLRYGSGGNHEVKLFGRDLSTNNTDVIKLNKKFKDDSIYKTMSLGESLVLKPNIEYTLLITYDNGGFTCWCATYRMTTIIIHDPINAVEMLQPGATMFELFFKEPLPTEQITDITLPEQTTAKAKDKQKMPLCCSKPPQQELVTDLSIAQASSDSQKHKELLEDENTSKPQENEKNLTETQIKRCSVEAPKQTLSESLPLEMPTESQPASTVSQSNKVQTGLNKQPSFVEPSSTLIKARTLSEIPAAGRSPDTSRNTVLSESTRRKESIKENSRQLLVSQDEIVPKPLQLDLKSEGTQTSQASLNLPTTEIPEPPVDETTTEHSAEVPQTAKPTILEQVKSRSGLLPQDEMAQMIANCNEANVHTAIPESAEATKEETIQDSVKRVESVKENSRQLLPPQDENVLKPEATSDSTQTATAAEPEPPSCSNETSQTDGATEAVLPARSPLSLNCCSKDKE